MHSPVGLEALGGADFDLALCGHTHGGQISLPGGRPILLPPALNRRYHAGRLTCRPCR
jgi:predicted MPP superfamily phosphohydrolase